MKRLLLVEDDGSLGATLEERLEREGYQTRWAQTFKEASSALSEGPWDLVILDVGLPDGSGFELGRMIKNSHSWPIVFVTAQGTPEDRLAGFELGADEFIPKPFHLKELLLRVKNVLERRPVRHEVAFKDMVIDLDAMAIRMPTGKIETPAARDFQVLKMLLQSSPKVLTRDEILDAVWGEEKFPSNRTVDNSIVRLRQVLGEEAIRSVRGVGYQWAQGSEE